VWVFLILSYHQDDDNATKIIPQQKSAIGFFVATFFFSLAMDKEDFESFLMLFMYIYLSIYLLMYLGG
jgi:hypothetical protein